MTALPLTCVLAFIVCVVAWAAYVTLTIKSIQNQGVTAYWQSEGLRKILDPSEAPQTPAEDTGGSPVKHAEPQSFHYKRQKDASWWIDSKKGARPS